MEDKMKRNNIVGEEIRQHVLTILACEKGIAMGEFAIQNLRVDITQGLYDNELLYALHTLIPAENVKEEIHTFSAKCPCNWKQAFKEEHFPEWLKKRYPVKYKITMKTVKFTAYNLYPQFPAVRPEACRGAVQYITKSLERCRDGWDWE